MSGEDFSEIDPSEMCSFVGYVRKYAAIRPKTLSCQFPFFIAISSGRQRYAFGQRPADLDDIDTIEQKAWRKHEAHLNRLEQFPLDKAEYYLRLKEAHGVNSVRGLSKITGEDWSYIARILKTLDLPASIKDFLKGYRNDPAVIKFFHLRRLLDIVRQGEERLQMGRFRELLGEFEGCGRWEFTA